jgi:hypothetical protein
MRNANWVVYSIPMKGIPEGVRAVCEQGEWEALDAAKPGLLTLVRGGISNEGEAERLARGTAGQAKSRNAKTAPLSWLDHAASVLAGPAAAAG